MFKKFIILGVLVFFLLGCGRSPINEEAMLTGFDEMLFSIERKGLSVLSKHVLENELIRIPGSPKNAKVEKQWIWKYDVKSYPYTADVFLVKIIVIRLKTTVFEFAKPREAEWAIFPEIYYWGKNDEIKTESHDAFAIKMLERFLMAPNPPNWQDFSARMNEHHQVALNILWLIAKNSDF